MHLKTSVKITMRDHDRHGDIVRIERILMNSRFNREREYSLGLLTEASQGRIAQLMRAANLSIEGGEIEFYLLKSRQPATLGAPKSFDQVMAEHKQRGAAERAFLAKLTGKTQAQIERDLTRKDRKGGA
jgi:hypothetical protein